ncbi:tRNA (guanosine(46)-N7)-methyltransferase TrmB [Treponema phagedenis]|nr:tRNA (guanosine(46)-N7)-methyltransferase TrmB [Treponema phagedenis]EFW39466.1 tRNA (guanine-N(7)-)-methyltransferase [Treponema phagedenis F0421]QEJ94853.1 tRNA (guanosine(46)-N7)-methyltransferase TrmB [Treponema phagedenis]QEK03404.1 tRNA (guanosine(46)-N7)-methyltransferase TrmB [Treponema phagedenis]QEK09032.1 tRNA (guanosine(46)-N7)-methyltransferase TrmB [Treponema phagedenis]QSH95429.1 tRNA (guanosine(46)-N7)-methyltransferase TrmB [Treponema phagedenis]
MDIVELKNRPILTFVLRAGRMTDGQKRDYAVFSKRWCIPYQNEPIQFEHIFGNSQPVIMEIGFGMGLATAEIAEKNPGTNYLGVEVYKPGVGKLLGEIEKRNLSNIRIIEYDAIQVLQTMIDEKSLAGFHIFFPDPWQKKKHHKRRLLHRPNTDLFVSRLRDGGYIYAVTDWEHYAHDAYAELSATAGLTSKYEGFAPSQSWRPKTKFELKGLKKDHVIRELFFTRTNGL